jgi:cysteinyl-tRNA synthetase
MNNPFPPLQLYNTLTAKKEPFVAQNPEHVTMYVCGPTVYNHPHIGNARPAVVFDVLYRLLQAQFPRVTYARNITDVDDKINKAAREQHVPISTITEHFTKIYHADVAALNCLPPTIEPRATDHIGEIISMIERLIVENYAYEAESHVLFHVPSFREYGALSKRSLDEMQAGSRVEVAPYKKHPMDFVLWKPSQEGDPFWPSPWGNGRPGWHIECSAMIETHLGNTIDIHGGGADLAFPHHENEIAQGVCSHHGEPYVRYWLHNGFVNVNAEKMSKSIGNVLLVKDLLHANHGEVIRLALLSAHYSKPLDWSDNLLIQAKKNIDSWYRALVKLAHVTAQPAYNPQFLLALQDDMNTPKAIAVLHELATNAQKAESPSEQERAKAELLGASALLGLLEQNPAQWLQGENNAIDSKWIETQIQARALAKSEKRYEDADVIRLALEQKGILLEDSKTGTSWRLQ